MKFCLWRCFDILFVISEIVLAEKSWSRTNAATSFILIFSTFSLLFSVGSRQLPFIIPSYNLCKQNVFVSNFKMYLFPISKCICQIAKCGHKFHLNFLNFSLLFSASRRQLQFIIKLLNVFLKLQNVFLKLQNVFLILRNVFVKCGHKFHLNFLNFFSSFLLQPPPATIYNPSYN